MAIDPILSYVHGPMRRVDGWFTRLDAELTATIARHQADLEVTGSVGEIGVHHGRMFVALALTMREGERAFAIDVFGDQHLNQDQSGHGDEMVFRENLARNGIDESRIAVIRGSSLDVNWANIEAEVGAPARLFSIDGGHTAAIVEHDLGIADAGLGEAGVVIADDYFDSGYPGVSEGTARFMLRNPDALRPFALGDSRMFLCRPEWTERYRRALGTGPLSKSHMRTAPMWGSVVSVFRTPRRVVDRIRGLAITRAVLGHPVGVRLEPLIRRLLTN